MEKASVVFLIAIFVLLPSIICQLAPTGYGFSIYEYGTILTTTAVVGDESCYNETFFGTGSCILDRGAISRPLVFCELIHNAEDPIEVTIRNGVPQENSNIVVYTFQPDEYQYGFFQGEIIRADFDINEDSSQDINFLNGEWYILIKTLQCPNGALRGQFTAKYNVASYLYGGNEVPPIASPEEGIVLGTYNYETNTLNNRIDYTAKNVTAIGLYEGASGIESTSDPFYSFDNTTLPINQDVVLTDAQENLLLTRDLYYNVLTTYYPFGELRGQVHIIDPVPSINYAFTLTSNQVVPPAANDYVGVGLFSVDCETGYVEYMITHNVPNARYAYLMFGEAGTDGVIAVTLHGVNSPIMGQLGFYADYYFDGLATGDFYVEIYSFSFPDGAIRGQIKPSKPFYTYISGYQETPIVTTHLRGNGVFDSQGNYLILHDGTNVVKANLDQGNIGSNQTNVSTFPSATSPMQGTIAEPNLSSGQFSINIITNSYPRGEARGQILPSATACTPRPVPIITSSSKGAFVTQSHVSTTSSSDANILTCSSIVVTLMLVAVVMMICI